LELILSGIAFVGLLIFFSITSIADILFVTHGRQVLFSGHASGDSVDFVKENPIKTGFATQLIRLFCGVGAAVTGAYWWVIWTNTIPADISTLDAVASVSMVMGLIWLFADVIPKVIATKYSDSLIPHIARLMHGLAITTSPLFWLSNMAIATLSRWVGGAPFLTQPWVTEDEIISLVDHAQQEGRLESSEKEMIQSIFQFSETVVREIMTPRIDAYTAEITRTVDEIIGIIRESGHSRIPIFSGTPDSIVGFAYAKDLLCNAIQDRSQSVGSYLRPAVFIPETQRIEMVLRELKKGKTHLAIVVDEFGVPSGLVTLEDVIEEIVGEIQDEYDPVVQSDLLEVEPGIFSVAGSLNVSDFSEGVGIALPESDDYDTVGGMVLHHAGSLPKKGESLIIHHRQFIVEDVSDRRITRIEFRKEVIE